MTKAAAGMYDSDSDPRLSRAFDFLRNEVELAKTRQTWGAITATIEVRDGRPHKVRLVTEVTENS